MDVLNRKALPLVGIGSLVLGGACDDGGLSTTGIARNFCSFMLECDTEYFNYYYDSLEQCVSETTTELEAELSYYEREYGADCADALFEYYQCLGRQYANLACDDRLTCDYTNIDVVCGF